MTTKQDILDALSAEQLAVQDLYKSLMDISVGVFGGLSCDDALKARYNAYLTLTNVVESHKHLTQPVQEQSS
jgi:hypothetical protein